MICLLCENPTAIIKSETRTVKDIFKIKRRNKNVTKYKKTKTS